MLYYARDQKVDNVRDIRELDLSSKGVLNIKELSVFYEMQNL